MRSPLAEWLSRHVEAGTIPGGVALLGAGEGAEVVSAGVASIGGQPMPADAIMRIQSMTKVITAVAALRLVAAGRLELDQSLAEWLPELASRQVLRMPTAALDDTVPARREITLRHLLTNTSGYGMIIESSPLQQAMADNGTEAGPEPPTLGADEWLRRLAELPLVFHPGEGWRYHHSFSVLGILIWRATGRPLAEHLAEDIFGPLGMIDTALWVPEEKLDRLPAAYRHGEAGLVETEPAGGGFYAGPPPFDVSHGELVSTARDFHRLTRMLADGGTVSGRPMISLADVRQITSDQVPDACKTADSFVAGFWDGVVGVTASPCTPMAGAVVDTDGPVDKARTSSPTATERSESCSPKWRWARRCRRCSRSSSHCTNLPSSPKRLPVGILSRMTGDTRWLDSMPEYYDRCLAPAVFAPYARYVAGIAATHAPKAVLEVAAGTGVVTAELVRALPAAQITATDLNPAMVAWAAQRVGGPAWMPADAQRLPFRDASFDMIVCQFGVMFLPDKAKAFAEAARVLRPDGLFGFTVWDTIDTSPLTAAVIDGLAEAIPDDPPDFLARIPHGYHDPDQVRLDIAAGGLVVESIERVVLRGTAPSARVIAEGFCYGTPLRFELEERGDVEHLTDELADRMTVEFGPGPVAGDMAGYVVSARRPRS